MDASSDEQATVFDPWQNVRQLIFPTKIKMMNFKDLGIVLTGGQN